MTSTPAIVSREPVSAMMVDSPSATDDGLPSDATRKDGLVGVTNAAPAIVARQPVEALLDSPSASDDAV